MAEQDKDDIGEETPGYKTPAQKSVVDILKQDAEDDSLRKYKETLLGSALDKLENVEVFPADPRRVIVTKLAVVVEGRPDYEIDLTGDLTNLKKKTMVMKEGSQFRVRIYFYVQREIVTGLKYVQKLYRKAIKVDKDHYMVGSFGPKRELQSYMTPLEDAPSGLMARGTYSVHSLFTDDDKHEHLKWEWGLEIKKDWE